MEREPELFITHHVLGMDSPLGRIWVESDGELITRVSFEALRSRPSKPNKLLLDARTQFDAFFARRRRSFDLPLQHVGTRFQKLVWAELAQIHFGQTSSYQVIADRIGGKAVARTVGNACGSNPHPIIVPCHRVIASNGLLTGYVGGLWRKKWLLEHEGVLTRDLF